jgi:uncharacterized protein YndB with AHSA1/START domain
MSEFIEVTEHIAAPPEAIWPYLTEPQLHARWMGTRVELDARPGGVYSAWMKEGLRSSGEFVELDPPRRLVFTWGWDHDPLVTPGSTRVEVTLEPEGDGTLVRLRHHDLPTPESCEHHTMGWRQYLSRLAIAATGGNPGPDPNAA